MDTSVRSKLDVYAEPGKQETDGQLVRQSDCVPVIGMQATHWAATGVCLQRRRLRKRRPELGCF